MDETAAAPDGDSPRVAYLVKRVEQAVRSYLDDATATFGMTTPQYAALSALRARPGLSSAELARMSFMSAQAMNQMVATLERKGLIRREASPHHRKQLRILLTDEGAGRLRRCDEHADALEERMFAGFTASERRTFTRLLRRCATALGDDRSRRVSAPAD